MAPKERGEATCVHGSDIHICIRARDAVSVATRVGSSLMMLEDDSSESLEISIDIFFVRIYICCKSRQEIWDFR